MASNFRIWTIGLLVLVIISLGISTFAVVFAMQSKDEQNSSNAPLVRRDRIDAQQSPSASPKMERPFRNRAQRNNRAAQITVNKFKDEPKGKKEKAEATLKALKDRYSEWCRQALTNSSKVKKRTALIQEDLDKVIAEWQASGVIK